MRLSTKKKNKIVDYCLSIKYSIASFEKSSSFYTLEISIALHTYCSCDTIKALRVNPSGLNTPLYCRYDAKYYNNIGNVR